MNGHLHQGMVQSTIWNNLVRTPLSRFKRLQPISYGQPKPMDGKGPLTQTKLCFLLNLYISLTYILGLTKYPRPQKFLFGATQWKNKFGKKSIYLFLIIYLVPDRTKMAGNRLKLDVLSFLIDCPISLEGALQLKSMRHRLCHSNSKRNCTVNVSIKV